MKPNLILIACLLISFNGCVSEKSVIMRYFTIEAPVNRMPGISATKPVINAVCEIGRVEINPVYESNQIANRSRSNEITYYVHNQWAIRPSVALRDIILRHLETSGIFRIVSERYSRAIPDYIFGTSVSNLELIEQNRALFVHLKLEFRLIDNYDDNIILRHHADTINVLERKDLNLFAGEVSNMFYGELTKFTKSILDNRSLLFKDPK